MSKREGGKMCARSSGLVEGRVVRLVYRYKSSGSEKIKKYLEQPRDYQELKEGNRSLGRPTHRFQDNMNTDLKGIGWNGMDQISLAQDRDGWQALVKMVVNFQTP